MQTHAKKYYYNNLYGSRAQAVYKDKTKSIINSSDKDDIATIYNKYYKIFPNIKGPVLFPDNLDSKDKITFSHLMNTDQTHGPLTFLDIHWKQFMERLTNAKIDDVITFTYKKNVRTVKFKEFYKGCDGGEPTLYATDCDGNFKSYHISKISWPIFMDVKKIESSPTRVLEGIINKKTNKIKNQKTKIADLQQELHETREDNIFLTNEQGKHSEIMDELNNKIYSLTKTIEEQNQKILLANPKGWEVL